MSSIMDKSLLLCDGAGKHDTKLCVPKQLGDLEFESIGELLLHSLRRNGDAAAQIDAVTGKTESYFELLSKCVRIAANLERIGLKQGDVISFCTMNNLNCYPTAMGCFIAGACFTAMDPILSSRDTEHLIKLLEPKYIFCDAAGVQSIEAAISATKSQTEIIFYGVSEKYISFSELLQCVENEDEYQVKKTNIEDTAAIFLSSGTTGVPKGIALSHRSLLKLCIQSRINIRTYVTSRLCWISTTMMFGSASYYGASWVMSVEYNSNDILRIVSQYKIGLLITQPFYAHQITKMYKESPYNLSSLRAYIVIGGIVSKKQVMAMRQFFPTTLIFTAYGLTETAGGILTFTIEDIEYINAKPGSVGRVVEGNCVKVIDVTTEKEVGPYEHGELRVKSSQLMNGYYKNAETTAAAFDKGGYFCTGDIVYYDEDGFFYFVERLKDVMIVKSFHVMPIELEEILLTHPDILEAVIISIPHEEDMDHPMALVKLVDGALTTAEGIRTFVDDQVVDYKQLRGGVKIVENIPKTATYKQRRRHIRNMVLQGDFEQFYV